MCLGEKLEKGEREFSQETTQNLFFFFFFFFFFLQNEWSGGMYGL